MRPVASRLLRRCSTRTSVGSYTGTSSRRTSAEVLSVHETKPVTQLAIKVERQDGETVLEGEAWCYTFSLGD